MASNLNTPKPSLASAIEKVNNAGIHIKTLHTQVRGFFDTQPHPYTHWIDSNLTHREELLISMPNMPVDGWRVGREIRLVSTVTDRFWVRIRINRPIPQVELGTVVGDVTHNLRSALDNLVFELARLHQRSPPPPSPIPRGNDWRYVSFPICLSEAEWNNHITRRKLKLVSPKVVPLILREQPFFGGKDRTGKIVQRTKPERHPLARLEELWNRDKHRSVSIVDSRVRFENFGPPPDDWSNPPLEFRVMRRRPLGPFENDTKLALVAITSADKVGHETLQEYLENYSPLTYNVGFEEGFPGYGKPVMETLEMLKDRVTAILVKFESKFR